MNTYDKENKNTEMGNPEIGCSEAGNEEMGSLGIECSEAGNGEIRNPEIECSEAENPETCHMKSSEFECITEDSEKSYRELGTERNENSYDGKKSDKEKFKGIRLQKRHIALLTAFCIAVSSISGFGGAMMAKKITSESEAFGTRGQSTEITIEQTALSEQKSNTKELSVKEIAALNGNSVVEISTESVATDSWMQQYVTKGAGSGVIVSANGYIVTNNHVIENSEKITVTLKNGKSYKATLVGKDGETDLAVLKIEVTGLTPAVYGDSDALEVGDTSVVIGNPLGQLGGTVTAGIVSALDRELTIDGKTMTLLQTDTSINPGNSGGGMFNSKGELVGIVVAKSSGSNVEGLGFAIPVNKVKEIAKQLADYGYVKGRVSAGITFVDLTSVQNAIYYGVRNLGIYVKSVDTNLAKESGLKAGDMIYYVGDRKISTATDLTSAINSYSVGDKVQITVVRDGEIKKIMLTLGEKTKG